MGCKIDEYPLHCLPQASVSICADGLCNSVTPISWVCFIKHGSCVVCRVWYFAAGMVLFNRCRDVYVSVVGMRGRLLELRPVVTCDFADTCHPVNMPILSEKY